MCFSFLLLQTKMGLSGSSIYFTFARVSFILRAIRIFPISVFKMLHLNAKLFHLVHIEYKTQTELFGPERDV